MKFDGFFALLKSNFFLFENKGQMIMGKPKKDRKGILQFFKNCLNDRSYNLKISGNPNLIILIEMLISDLHKHYGFSDIEKDNTKRGSRNQLRFFLLYVDNNDMTFEEISEESFIESDTLKYYVRLYNQTALQFIKEESNYNPDYAFLLNEYLKSEL